jgi:hypothetical protein
MLHMPMRICRRGKQGGVVAVRDADRNMGEDGVDIEIFFRIGSVTKKLKFTKKPNN